MKNIERRIRLMKRKSPDAWISKEQFKCPGCGEGFRYRLNLKEHIKRCWDYKIKNGK